MSPPSVTTDENRLRTANGRRQVCHVHHRVDHDTTGPAPSTTSPCMTIRAEGVRHRHGDGQFTLRSARQAARPHRLSTGPPRWSAEMRRRKRFRHPQRAVALQPTAEVDLVDNDGRECETGRRCRSTAHRRRRACRACRRPRSTGQIAGSIRGVAARCRDGRWSSKVITPPCAVPALMARVLTLVLTP